jgi:hypothetical protein
MTREVGGWAMGPFLEVAGTKEEMRHQFQASMSSLGRFELGIDFITTGIFAAMLSKYFVGMAGLYT